MLMIWSQNIPFSCRWTSINWQENLPNYVLENNLWIFIRIDGCSRNHPIWFLGMPQMIVVIDDHKGQHDKTIYRGRFRGVCKGRSHPFWLILDPLLIYWKSYKYWYCCYCFWEGIKFYQFWLWMTHPLVTGARITIPLFLFAHSAFSFNTHWLLSGSSIAF
mgnify:CR=1 FL=1